MVLLDYGLNYDHHFEDIELDVHRLAFRRRGPLHTDWIQSRRNFTESMPRHSLDARLI